MIEIAEIVEMRSNEPSIESLHSLEQESSAFWGGWRLPGRAPLCRLLDMCEMYSVFANVVPGLARPH